MSDRTTYSGERGQFGNSTISISQENMRANNSFIRKKNVITIERLKENAFCWNGFAEVFKNLTRYRSENTFVGTIIIM